MTGRGRSDEQKVIDLVDQACNGRLTAAGAEELHRLLSLDVQHFQTCVQYLDMHAALVHYAVEPLTSHELIATIRNRNVRDRRRQMLLIVSGMVAGVAAVLLVGFGLISAATRFGNDLKNQLAEAKPAPAVAPIPVARLHEVSSGAGWQGTPRAAGEALFGNDRIELRQGRVVLEFPSGVELRFQGPGTLSVESATSVRLHGGRALANVPPAGVGFAVRVGESVIVDYGTEFLVDASIDQTAAVAVRQGQVGLGFDSQPPGNRPILGAGNAAKMEGSSKTIAPTFYDVELFRPFDLDMARITSLSGRVRLVQEPRPTFPLNFVTPAREGFLLREAGRRELAEDLRVEESFGTFELPKGTLVDSFLFHFSPDNRPTSRIQGSMTFENPILAVISRGETLAETDKVLAIAADRVSDVSRGLEQENKSDTLRISEDRRTLSFEILTAESFTDQFRILVQSPPDK